MAAALALAWVSAGCGVQPSEPIGGSAATGALVYLVRDDTVVPVLRPTKQPTTGARALALLAEGPNGREQAQGLTTAVPPGTAPVLSGNTITVATDVSTLPEVAVSQLVCTAAAAEPLTLVGGGHRRGPLTCPV
ncbi:putative secreted protein [Saccharothrix espanaensis DSM 44229]|uniref:Putative secreted protein n=1 Tax=Saccharothrix espanaensis (strain ATCC 51144 / DSM 44229 / JCM 9112 / NBRC 15066 / NRRL 15764) TaxID=1179773 RepID=K0JST2_SACES|nr:putative secreted protein [Saccharothrix espanaensis DSM 44229]